MAGKGSTELVLEERKQIEFLLKNGYRAGGIAKILQRTHCCIKQEIRKNGHKANYNAMIAHQAAEIRKKSRLCKLKGNLTEEEIALITDAINQGLSLNKISKLVGISSYKISAYLRGNNIKWVPKGYLGFENRVQSLEMQIEIVLDELRELRKQK